MKQKVTEASVSLVLSKSNLGLLCLVQFCAPHTWFCKYSWESLKSELCPRVGGTTCSFRVRETNVTQSPKRGTGDTLDQLLALMMHLMYGQTDLDDMISNKG